MRLPFSESAFLDLFGEYNSALWPLVILLWAVSILVAVRWWRGRASARSLMALLAVHWALSSAVYHWWFFRRINPAATVFAALFFLQAVLFVWLAFTSRARFPRGGSARDLVARALVMYGLAYPLLGLAFGLRYPRLPLFAVPCPTTLVTAGLLLASAGVPRSVRIVPIVWCAIGSSGAILLGVRADLALVAAGVLLAIDAVAPRRLPLVVFDLDGTLVDSRRDLADSVNALLAELGRPPLDEAVVGDMVGEGAKVLIQRALAASDVDPAGTAAALHRFLELYDERLLRHTHPYDGIPELLASLHGRAILAVLTNKPQEATRRVLGGLGLARFFGEVIGSDSTFPRKPDPGALRHLMKRSGADPDHTLMVGDSRIDLEAARNAGVHICLVRYGFGFRFGPEELRDVAIADSPPAIARAAQAIGI